MSTLEKESGPLRRLNDASLMCFSVALGAFVAAGIGALINHWLTGWMAVGGLAGVGLLYFAIGIFNLKSPARVNPPAPFEDVSSAKRTTIVSSLPAGTVPWILDLPSRPSTIPGAVKDRSAGTPQPTDDRRELSLT